MEKHTRIFPQALKLKSVAHVLLLFITCSQGHITVKNLPNRTYRKSGDFDIGVLLPVYGYDFLYSRGALLKLPSLSGFSLLQRVEAIAFAIDEINERHDLLEEFTLGYVMFDDRYKESTALAQTLRFIQNDGTCQDEDIHTCSSTDNSMDTFRISALIAAESSTITSHVANLMANFQIPQISYLTTTSRLSKKDHPNFFRTTPSDKYQAEAIISLMNFYEWKYGSILYSSGDYGSEGYKEVLHAANRFGICFGVVREIRDDWRVRDYQNLILELLLDKNSTAVVAFTNLAHAKALLHFANKLKANGRITWIASDAWARELTDLAGILLGNFVGAFSVKVEAINPPRFYKRFRRITPQNHVVKNPWLKDYLEVYFNCTYPASVISPFRTCKPKLNISNHIENPREKSVSLVYDAVYAIAHALQDALDSEECRDIISRNETIKCAATNLMNSLRSVNFTGETQQVYFSKTDQSVQRMYHIYNVQNRTGEWRMIHVSTYDPIRKSLNQTGQRVQWSQGRLPRTLCNKECEIGHAQRVTERSCCWICFKCPAHHIVTIDILEGGRRKKKCEECPPGAWPDQEARIRCLRIEPTHVKWNDPLGVIVCSFAATGLAACLTIFILYTMNYRHPFIKASSRELSFFLLASCAVCYAFCFFLIVQPSNSLCILRQVGVCLCHTLVYAPIATKTIRIYRIFEAGMKLQRTPKCVSLHSQLGIVLSIVIIHLILIMGFVIVIPPRVELRSSLGVNRVDFTCSRDNRAYITSFTFNALLLVISMFCAFKTRKLPDHFNEAKFLTFCIYSTLIVWLAFIPAYMIVNTNSFQIMLLALAMLLNTSLILTCMFVPKLVAVYMIAKTPDKATTSFRMKAKHQRRRSTRKPDADEEERNSRNPAAANNEQQNTINISVINTLQVPNPSQNIEENSLKIEVHPIQVQTAKDEHSNNDVSAS